MDKQDPKAEKSEGSCGNECTEMHTGKVGCKLEVENSYKTWTEKTFLFNSRPAPMLLALDNLNQMS